MGKKPKYLHRTSELGDWFASIGRKLKEYKRAGINVQFLRKQHSEIREFRREQKTFIRHLRWQEVYEAVFEEEHKRALEQLCYSEKKAFSYARKKAELAVVDEFSGEIKTTRAVRNAINKLNDAGD